MLDFTETNLQKKMPMPTREISGRKALLDFDATDVKALLSFRTFIESKIDTIVNAFYAIQTNEPEIAQLISEPATLKRLQGAQRKYVLDLFAGNYDEEYVNNRLQIGLVHKRIGVAPKLYLSAVHLLRRLIVKQLAECSQRPEDVAAATIALDKLIFFDITLIFDTYIQSMVSEVETAKHKAVQYAKLLEETVAKRDHELRTDALTGLTTRRYLHDILQRKIYAAQRRTEPVSIVFMDIDDFKTLNDTKGHAFGDTVLGRLGGILLEVSRNDDVCVRYGGDEFCVILANTTEALAKTVYCERVNILLSQRLDGVAVSMGVFQTGPDQFKEVDALLHYADKRMYLEKRLRKKLKK
ncbi:MAG: diguanylate cyclase [Paraglaciecola sp.]|jgi:diguanylate cyclase